MPLPGKDEVAIVDGKPISLSAYLFVRSKLKNQQPQTVFWASIGSVALQNEAASRGQDLPVPVLLSLVRYALEELPVEEAEPAIRDYYGTVSSVPAPKEIKAEIDRLINKAAVQRNLALMGTL